MFRQFTFFLCIFFYQYTFAQFKEEKIKLPSDLNEISGLEMINDSILVAHNDSENEPRVFFLAANGMIIHSCFISNASNIDWEDLTRDEDGNLYIADVGNNLNNRKNLCIYKIKIKDALEKERVEAEIIHFSCIDQLAFPPDDENLDFDFEAIYFHQDSLYLVSKSRSKPWKGIATIYSLSINPGNQIAHPINYVLIGDSGWKKDAITAADAQENDVCLLTYNRWIVYTILNGNLTEKETYKFKRLTQKEAIVLDTESNIFIGAEKHPLLGGPYLYKITKK